MKSILVMAVLALGVSAHADNHGHKAKTTTTTQEKTTTTEAPATHAMSAKEATDACNKEGKKGAALTACIKEKQAAHQ